MMEDDRHDIMKKVAREQAKALAYTIELQGWDLLNSGFVTTARTGIDSLALLVASHPLYGPQGGTASNLLTGSARPTQHAGGDGQLRADGQRAEAYRCMRCLPSSSGASDKQVDGRDPGASQQLPGQRGQRHQPREGQVHLPQHGALLHLDDPVGAPGQEDPRPAVVWRRHIKYEPAIDFITGNVRGRPTCGRWRPSSTGGCRRKHRRGGRSWHTGRPFRPIYELTGPPDRTHSDRPGTGTKWLWATGNAALGAITVARETSILDGRPAPDWEVPMERVRGCL